MAVPELVGKIQAFQNAVANSLASFGFKRLNDDDDFDSSFWRRGDSRSLRFGVGVVDHETVVYLGATAGIRFEEIEVICHEASGLPADIHAETVTIAAPNLSPNGRPEENVGRLANGAAPDSVGKLAATAERLFTSLAVPFFDRFKTIQDADVVLNSQPSVNSPYLVPDYERCCRGLVAAKLVGRPNLQDLLTIYIDRMQKTANGFYFKRFMRLVTLLGLG